MTEPITLTMPLWQWIAAVVLFTIGGLVGNITGNWLTRGRKTKASTDA